MEESFLSGSIPFADTSRFSPLFTDYANRKPGLEEFYGIHPADAGAFARQYERKIPGFSSAIRATLHQTLRQQMEPFGLFPRQEENLQAIARDGSASISCGHQLCIGGGPLFVAFKLLQTLRLAEEISTPEKPVVPVFWLASEDHDTEEIQTLRFCGKSIRFPLEQNGPTGRIPAAAVGLEAAMAEGLPAPMMDAYRKAHTLTGATRIWLQHYFGAKGILVLDADDPNLKRIFLPWMEKEMETSFSERTITEQTRKLEALGYKPQVSPRPVNLFFMEGHTRQRLEKDASGNFSAGSLNFGTAGSALTRFRQKPEELSPNVCLRPLYSQVLLPDIGFVGGPAELAYWLQSRLLFEEAGIPMPVLVPRLSGTWISGRIAGKMQRLGLNAGDLFRSGKELKSRLFPVFETISLPDLSPLFENLRAHARAADPTLVPAVESENIRIARQLEGLARRIRKGYERKDIIRLQHLESIQKHFFPEGDLQERQESWLGLEALNPGWLDRIYRSFSPLSLEFYFFQDGGSST